MRDAFAKRLVELAKDDPSIELLTGDLGFGVLREFQSFFPERFHNVGIAEQLMIEMATGMALAGKKVVCYSIGNFPVLRCLEQIRNDAAYSGANVKIVEVGGGYTYGQLGMSHNATEDLACLLPMDGISVFTPSDKAEATLATDLMFKTQGTTFLRLERPDDRGIHGAEPIQYHPSTFLKILDGQKIAVLSYGGIAFTAKEVAFELGASFYTFPMLKPLLEKQIYSELSQYDCLIVIEEHSRFGGLGSIVENLFGCAKKHPQILKFGTPSHILSTIGSQEYMRRISGLLKESVLLKIAYFIESTAIN